MIPEGPFLVVETSSGRYALPADKVRQVLWLPVLADSDAELKGQIGTAPLEEDEVPVVDLDLALGEDPEPYGLDHRVVEVAPNGTPLGLVVAAVVDVVELTEDDVVHREPDEEPTLAAADTPEGLVELVDLPELATQPPGDERLRDPGELFEGLEPEELEELERRQHRAATDAQPPAAGPERSAAIAEVGSASLAIPLEAVLGFVRIETTTPVPHTPDHVIGLTNHRGEVVSVVDPGPPLGLEPASSPPDLGALVETREGLTALAIDRVGRTITIDEGELDETRSGPGVQGLVEVDGTQLPLLDVPGLLGSERVVVDQGAVPS